MTIKREKPAAFNNFAETYIKPLYSSSYYSGVTYQTAAGREHANECNCFHCAFTRAQQAFVKTAEEAFGGTFPRHLAVNDLSVFQHMPIFGTEKTHDHMLSLATDRAIELLKLKPTKLRTHRCQECGEFVNPSRLTKIVLPKSRNVNKVPYRRSPGAVKVERPDIEIEKYSFHACPRCTMKYRKCETCDIWDYYRSPNGFGVFRVLQTFRMNEESHFACYNCLQTHYERCVKCGGYDKKEHITTVKNVISLNYEIPAEVDYILCRSCKEVTTFVNCAVCNGLFDRSHIRLDRRDRPRCQPCERLQTATVQNHNFKPSRFPVLSRGTGAKKLGTNQLLFGCEIEMEPATERAINRDEMAATLLRELGRDRVLCKHDGTVRTGVELVTFPFTWDYFTNNALFFQSIYNIINTQNYSCSATGHAGLHVHMSKNAFTTFHLYKFLKFMFASHNREALMFISERKANWDYAKWENSDIQNPGKCAKLKKNVSELRYSAVNLLYKPTVEMRLFGGVDSVDSFFKNIEFCHALYEFTKDASTKQLDMINFCMFIVHEERKGSYRHLIKFLAEHTTFFKKNKVASMLCRNCKLPMKRS